jgi:hypothetical protein
LEPFWKRPTGVPACAEIPNEPKAALVPALDNQFSRLHSRSQSLIERLPLDRIYWQPHVEVEGTQPYSCGEYILRSAAAVEQTFGGITANLWDDPFEWTLPENLKTRERIADYLDEVEATRRRAFERFAGDDDLTKEVAVPQGETLTLFALLTDTLVRGAHHPGCAYAVFMLFSGERLPRV